MKYFFESFVFIYFVFSLSIFSETVILKNGNIIKAKVVNQNPKEITIKKENGSTQNYSKNSILKIVYKDIDANEAKNIKEEEERKILEKNKKLTDKKISEEPIITEKESKKEQTQYSRRNIIFSSMVLPGWGQYKENRNIFAIVYPSVIGVLLFGAYQKNREYRNASNDYNSLNSPYFSQAPSSATFLNPGTAYIYSHSFDSQKEAVENHQKERNMYLFSAILVYLINIVDAGYFYKNDATQGILFNYTPSVKKGFLGESIFESKTSFGVFYKF